MAIGRIGGLAAAAALAACIGCGAALAQDKPADVIKYRQNVMKSIAAVFGDIQAVAKGEVSFVAHVPALATHMSQMAAIMPAAFPRGTGRDANETRAKPEIWADWDKFAAAAKAMGTETAKMAQIAAGGDRAAIGAQVAEIGKTCGGCHRPYRAD